MDPMVCCRVHERLHSSLAASIPQSMCLWCFYPLLATRHISQFRNFRWWYGCSLSYLFYTVINKSNTNSTYPYNSILCFQ